MRDWPNRRTMLEEAFDKLTKNDGRSIAKAQGRRPRLLVKIANLFAKIARQIIQTSDILSQPPTSGVIDAGPFCRVARYFNNEQLLLAPDVRSQSVTDLSRRMGALHDPHRFEVMPPRAKRLYRADEIIICGALRRMNIVGDEDRGVAGPFQQMPERLMLRTGCAVRKKSVDVDLRRIAA
jgi:hypothetical protein